MTFWGTIGGKLGIPRLLRLAALLLASSVFASFFLYGEIRDGLVDDTRFRSQINDASRTHQLDPDFVRALILRESRFDPFCRGRKGEYGLMQVLPAGAMADYCRLKTIPLYPTSWLYDPVLNLEIGCWYLARARLRWRHYALRDALALCHYNAGERRTAKWAPENPQDANLDALLMRINIATTRNYVKTILSRYDLYRRERQQQEGLRP